MSTPVVALEGIGKSFFGVPVLDGITMDVRPGEVHALVGENGAGKSTLMKILAGVHQPDDLAAAGDDVEGVEVPEDVNAVNLYPIATVADSEEAELAQGFVDLVLARTGQDVLADAGFAPAP